MPKILRKSGEEEQKSEYALVDYVSSLTLELHKMAKQAGYENVCTHLAYAYYEARGIANRCENGSAGHSGYSETAAEMAVSEST